MWFVAKFGAVITAGVCALLFPEIACQSNSVVSTVTSFTLEFLWVAFLKPWWLLNCPVCHMRQITSWGFFPTLNWNDLSVILTADREQQSRHQRLLLKFLDMQPLDAVFSPKSKMRDHTWPLLLIAKLYISVLPLCCCAYGAAGLAVVCSAQQKLFLAGYYFEGERSTVVRG